MSEIIRLIKLKQPDGTSRINKGEILKTEPQRCAYCNGRGGWYIDERAVSYDPAKGEHAKRCPVCKGTGEVAAQIVIGWASVGELKELFK